MKLQIPSLVTFHSVDQPGALLDQSFALAARAFGVLFLAARDRHHAAVNQAVSALRFFFGVTLGRGDAEIGMTTVAMPRRLPVILSVEEVARLLDAPPGPKYKAAFSLA